MNTDDEQLTRLLRENEPAYIRDDGFSTQVLARLPAARRRAPASRRALILLAAGVGACVLFALLAYPSLQALAQGLLRLEGTGALDGIVQKAAGALSLASFAGLASWLLFRAGRFRRELRRFP